jgi:DNA polymerase-3 subunit delta
MAERRVVIVRDPAFLDPRKKTSPVKIFHDSIELHRLGSLERSAALMALCLDLEPEEFAEGGTDFRRAVEAFKEDNEKELSTVDLEFLNDTAHALTMEIDTAATPTNASDVDRLLEYLKALPLPTTVLIFVMTSPLDGRGKVVKTISKVGTVVNFGRIRAARYVNRDPMYQMVVDKLREYSKTIAPDAFTELQKKTGQIVSGRLYHDMGQMFDELNKLVTFVGTRQRIEKRDVEELVTRTGFDGIFSLTDAISQKSLPLALARLKSIMDKAKQPGERDNTIFIHIMLTRQIRLLLQAKLLLENGDLKQEMTRMSRDAFQNNVYKKLPPDLIDRLPDSKPLNLLKQHPYVLYLTLRQAKNFEVQELVKAMERLLEADIQLKTGRLTPGLVVEMLVMDLCSSPKNPRGVRR